MTVATKIMMGSGAVESGYEIEQSAIFNGDAGLYRTSAGGDRRTWTLSVWVKRNNLGGWQNIIGGATNSPADYVYINADNQVAINGYQSGVPTNFYTETTRVLRDVAAWYHIVVNFDSTQGTAANRMKIWINGVQETSFDVLISPSQNFQTQFNENGVTQYIGRDYTTSSWMKGQLAEMHFLDGVTKPASNFGETNSATGQWIPKEYEGGSYGTNGYYLKFASGAIGTDSSGNGNTHTVQSLANSDIVTDSPTNNFCTMNELNRSTVTLSEGSLLVTNNSENVNKGVLGTISVSSGKWYWEMKRLSWNIYEAIGVAISSASPTQVSTGGGSINVMTWGADTIYQNGSSVQSGLGGCSDNDIIGVALNLDGNTVQFYKNNSAIGSAVSIPAGYSWVPTHGTNTSGYTAAATSLYDFGQSGFAYTPPSGFNAISTANLPAPAIPLPSAHFNTVLYTGNQTARTIDVGMQPSFTWIKARNAAHWHYLADAVRGFNTATNGSAKALSSNDNAAEITNQTTQLMSFVSNGFTLGDNSVNAYSVNLNSTNYVSWNWKANGAGSTNNDGNQASVVSANQAAGFSIATFTGTGSYATYGHGLGVIPEVTLTRSRSATGDWYWGTTVIDGSLDYLVLNTTAAKANSSATASTSSVFYASYNNAETVVAYNFASKPSFSKIGVYTGNGNADGPFVNCGFKPAWLMVKKTSATNNWILQDNQRSTFNLIDDFLAADEAQAESTTSAVGIDFLSNGFKIRNSANAMNTNSGTYLYMAFAESPFKTANAR